MSQKYIGDPALIHPLLAEITNSKRKSFEDGANVDIAAAALHLAIRCASRAFLSLILRCHALRIDTSTHQLIPFDFSFPTVLSLRMPFIRRHLERRHYTSQRR